MDHHHSDLTHSTEPPRQNELPFNELEQRRQWRERLMLSAIGVPTIIYFTGIFDHVLVPLLQGSLPTAEFQIPSIIAPIMSIPLCVLLYQKHRRQPYADLNRVSTAQRNRAVSYTVVGMIALNLLMHRSQEMRQVITAILLTVVSTLPIVLGFELFCLLLHPPHDIRKP